MRQTRADQPLMTFAEAAALDPDERGGELDAGKWVPVTRNTWRHGHFAGNAYFLLRLYADAHPGWYLAVGDPGSKLSEGPAVLRGPDVGMVRAERVPLGAGEAGWLSGAPELAVEVRGDAQEMSKLTRKALEYLRGGAKQVWVLDPQADELILFTPPDHVRVLGRDEVLDGSELLPGFRCPVADFFK